jgi:alpha-glucosidase
MWWRDAVIYQVYPRSFQDSDGDGVGDLAGLRSRLDHLVELGVDGLWLSPIYPSPLADLGYDVSDYTDVDPAYGTLSDFDALVRAAHERELRLLMDVVPCHTSVEHPWFREHPDWYIWAEGRDGGPPNNWRAAFGGPAWSFDEGRRSWYLHSFYPEQPDLDWRNPEVVAAMQEVLRFWLGRGVDGYRVDAIDHLLKDPELRDDPPSSEPFALPVREDSARLALTNSRNAPDTGDALAAIREACGGAFLAGEIYLPSAAWRPYLEHLDVAFAFELFHAPWEAAELRAAISASLAAGEGRAAWVLSSHDFTRVSTRLGAENARAAAMLLLTLPGVAFVYQGDEIGMTDGPGVDPAFDRAGRDAHRHPMQWDASLTGGFTNAATPWLPLVDPAQRNVVDQGRDPASLLALYRRLIAMRPRLGNDFRLIDAADGVLAYKRGGNVVAINTTGESRPAPASGEALLETAPGAVRAGMLAPHAGVIAAAD